MNAAAFYSTVRDLLKADGYEVHGPLDDGAGQYGYWFSWRAEGTGIEVGPTFTQVTNAWASALLHRLQNSHIMHTHALQGFASLGPEEPPEWGDTSFEGAEAFEEAEALYCLAETARNALKHQFPNS